MYKSRKDKNKRKYKESIKIVLAIVIVVGAGIMYAGFNNLNKNISKEDNITVENEESFQESNEVKNSSVSQELSIVRVAAIPEGIQALTNTFESVKALNENVEVDIVSNEYNNELILSLINGEHDIIVTSRQMNEEEKLQAKIEHTKRFQEIKDIINKEEYDLLILDEIIATINNEFIELNDVIEFLRNKPKSLEVVMTGRDPKDELVELSNYVTEMKCIKHPFKEGIPSRVGIEL